MNTTIRYQHGNHDRPSHTSGKRILLIEDDNRLATALCTALTRHGYEIIHARTAAEGFASWPYDLVLLDLGLPDADGIDLCRKLRHQGDTGIIILTGRADERDRVMGLVAGADDYIVKPFSLVELRARLDAVLRRYRPSENPSDPGGTTLTLGSLHLDSDQHKVTIGEQSVDLTRKEFEILTALARSAGKVISRERLINEAWQTSWIGKSRSIDVHIAKLRAKLGQLIIVENIRGVGYRLVPPPGLDERSAGHPTSNC